MILPEFTRRQFNLTTLGSLLGAAFGWVPWVDKAQASERPRTFAIEGVVEVWSTADIARYQQTTPHYLFCRKEDEPAAQKLIGWDTETPIP